MAHEHMVEHHIHYKEIHGFDETVWMPKGEHRRLHHRLRKEGKCNIPVDELEKISKRASKRTVKGRENHRNYNLNYKKNYMHELNLDETLYPNIRHRMNIRYNSMTEHISVFCRFSADHGKKLLCFDCKDSIMEGL